MSEGGRAMDLLWADEVLSDKEDEQWHEDDSCPFPTLITHPSIEFNPLATTTSHQQNRRRLKHDAPPASGAQCNTRNVPRTRPKGRGKKVERTNPRGKGGKRSRKPIVPSARVTRGQKKPSRPEKGDTLWPCHWDVDWDDGEYGMEGFLPADLPSGRRPQKSLASQPISVKFTMREPSPVRLRNGHSLSSEDESDHSATISSVVGSSRDGLCTKPTIRLQDLTTMMEPTHLNVLCHSCNCLVNDPAADKDGFIYCYGCLGDYVMKHGQSVEGTYMTVLDIRRLRVNGTSVPNRCTISEAVRHIERVSSVLRNLVNCHTGRNDPVLHTETIRALLGDGIKPEATTSSPKLVLNVLEALHKDLSSSLNQCTDEKST